MSQTTQQFQYTPRAQFLDFHNRTQRWACMCAHRRSGKTFAALADMIIKALRTRKKHARYAYVAPFRTQAKKIAWTYLKSFTEGIREGAPREADLEVRLPNGAWVTIYGADNPDALRGLYFDGVVLDEYGDMKSGILGEIVLPTLVDRKGWLVLMGTVKGRNEFYEAMKKAENDPKWFYKRLPASQSGIIPPEELQAIREQTEPGQYDQEFELNVDAALKGTYYMEIISEIQNEGRITLDKLYDPEQKVHVASDIGFSDSCAWWFWQPRLDGFAVIDYYESNGKGPEWYLEVLARKGYDYEEIWLPHDAKSRSFASKRSTIEQMMDPHAVCPEFYPAGTRLPLRIVPRMAIQHGIDAVRMVLRMCWFQANDCAQGLDSLRTYSRRWNPISKVFDDKPKHDDASHGADAFRGMALVARGSRGQSAESHLRHRRGNNRDGITSQRHLPGYLQYKNGRIVTVQTLDEMAPLKEPLRLARARRI